MKKLRLRDLKPYLSFYNDCITFYALVPTIDNPNVLVPFLMRYDYQNIKKLDWYFKKQSYVALGKAIVKIVTLYNTDSFVFKSDGIHFFWKDQVPPKWKDKILDIKTLRKIANEYLAR